MRIEESLREQVEEDIRHLKTLEAGSKEYEATAETIAKFSDRLIEIQKHDNKMEQDIEKQEQEVKFKNKELLVKTIGIAATLLGTVATVTVSIILKKKEIASNEKLKKAEMEFVSAAFEESMKFEETQTLTTQTGKKILNKAMKYV